jgi:hypothetical protein
LGGAAGSESFRAVVVAGQNIYVEARGGVYGTNTPSLISRPPGAGAGFNIANGNQGPVSFHTNDVTGTSLQLRAAHTASAVNFVQVTGAATGGAVAVTAQGSDTNVQLTLQSKGAGTVNLIDGSNSTGLRVTRSTAGGDTFLDVQRNVGLVELKAASGVTNGAFLVQSKGTGAINLAPGSSGVNISNGGTVTAITRTAAGSGYTSVPSVAISAPTTAGGVTATATCTVGVATFAVAAGGTGYAVGNVLTVVGGTGTAATFTVATLSGSAVATVTSTNAGSYSAVPTNPASTTGGTGTGCTININTYAVTSGGFTITNAGSGYVEQPTVTFSGGGGSGAAAYASVGGVTELKFIGTGTDSVTNQAAKITTSAGTAMTFRQIAGVDTFWQVGPASGTTGLIAKGNANGSALIGANGSGSVRLTTNGDSINEQMRVSHTASAVNYVQVTGAATGIPTTISAQGSDANITMAYSSKGFSANHRFQLGGAEALRIEQFGTTAVVNRFSMFANTAGGAPLLATRGSDTNVGLDFSTQGTGIYKFFTNTASNGTGAEQLRVAHTASAVNFVQVTGGATGGSVLVSGQGSDSNVEIRVQPKGTGAVGLMGGDALTQLQVGTSAASGNTFLKVVRSNGFVDLQATSGVSNGDITLTPKGTGNVRFGTFTADMTLVVQGYVEVKDSGGTIRKLAVIA